MNVNWVFENYALALINQILIFVFLINLDLSSYIPEIVVQGLFRRVMGFFLLLKLLMCQQMARKLVKNIVVVLDWAKILWLNLLNLLLKFEVLVNRYSCHVTLLLLLGGIVSCALSIKNRLELFLNFWHVVAGRLLWRCLCQWWVNTLITYHLDHIRALVELFDGWLGRPKLLMNFRLVWWGLHALNGFFLVRVKRGFFTGCLFLLWATLTDFLENHISLRLLHAIL